MDGIRPLAARYCVGRRDLGLDNGTIKRKRAVASVVHKTA
jgi:hypothetical protein